MLFRSIKNKLFGEKSVESLQSDYIDDDIDVTGEEFHGFRCGELVILKSNNRQMRIKDYNAQTDSFDCYTGNYAHFEGSFKADELAHFAKRN